MIDQLNNLLQRLTGFKRKKTMAELGYHGTGGFGNTLIARAYLPTADELGYHGTAGCGNTLIARAYLPTQENN